ncbi:Crp/Fnr family transcriptional regulator [Paenibacillus sp. KN14-4R]|uniref:Crp/Fnr family transcriptional regulator n=1 Tax=Paenibacillus sp. KN14-4R TaxID=3445773 RepID=UPI003FA18CE6
MREMKDLEQVRYYLQTHQIESIFNEPLIPHLSLYCFEQGEFICSQGESSEMLYLLVQGKIKIHTTSAEGKTLILSFKTPLDAVGDIEYVQGIETINTVEAVSSVYMIGVHHRMLKKYVKDHSPFLEFLLEIISRKFYMKSKSMSFNLMYPVEVRLASYLLSVIFDDNEMLPSGRLNISHLTDIANLIGTSYRHLNRVIHKFYTDGLIERKKGFILIQDREGLMSLANHNIYE